MNAENFYDQNRNLKNFFVYYLTSVKKKIYLNNYK